MGSLRRIARLTAGLLLGGVSAFGDACFVVVAAAALAVPPVRGPVFAAARALAELERWRLARFFTVENGDDYTGDRALRYLAARWVPGGIGAGIFVLTGWGAVSAAIMGWQLVSGRPLGGGEQLRWWEQGVLVLLGLVLLFLAVQGLLGVVVLERRLAHRFFGPSEQELLRRRVSELAVSRAEVLEAVTGERRRIERDLHDGVQQRLVALGMLLGRARRANDDELLRQAHEETQLALEDLREVAWRVHPVALDEGGLPVALEALAERASLPVRLRCEVGRLAPAIETVAYFVVAEAVTNALKHAAASRIDIDVTQAGAMVFVQVSDDGTGGASTVGGGLSGLARRVRAVEGAFTVDSPAGGPTRIGAKLPCG